MATILKELVVAWCFFCQISFNLHNYLGEYIGSANGETVNQTTCRSNQLLVFDVRERVECPEKNDAEQRRAQTNSNHV